MSRAVRALATLAALVVVRAEARADEPVEVEVHGTALARVPGDDAIATTSIDDTELAAPGLAVGDALARVPGATVTRTGGAQDLATVSLRGATSAETSVYLGPIRLNDEFTGTADLSLFPVGFFRRIDVYRGHAPLRLDRPGLGGAVVLSPELPEGTRVRASTEAGSFGEHATMAAGSIGDARASAALSVRLDGTRGDYPYVDDRGTRFDASDDRVVRRANADARSLDVWSAVRVGLGGRGSLAVLANGFGREQGAPGLAIVPARRARETTTRALAATLGSLACADAERCRLDTFVFFRRGTLVVRDPARELPFATTRQSVESESAGAGASVFGKVAPSVDLEGGARAGSEHLALTTASSSARDAARLTSRFFGVATFHPVPELGLSAGGALEATRTDGPGAPSGDAYPTARAGIDARVAPPLQLFASVARYVRSPTLAEAYGASATIVGNPALREESGGSLDVGARFESSVGDGALTLGAELVGFGRLADGLITYKRSSAGVLRPYNVGSARVLGAELALRTTTVGALHVDLAASASDPRDTTEGRLTTNDLIPFLARWTVTPRIGLELHDLVPEARWDRAAASVDLGYRSSRVADPAGLVELPEAIELGAEASVGFARGAFGVTARVTNLLDRSSTDLLGYPLPGRALHVSIEGALL